jgi:hypothetical protein
MRIGLIFLETNLLGVVGGHEGFFPLNETHTQAYSKKRHEFFSHNIFRTILKAAFLHNCWRCSKSQVIYLYLEVMWKARNILSF